MLFVGWPEDREAGHQRPGAQQLYPHVQTGSQETQTHRKNLLTISSIRC